MPKASQPIATSALSLNRRAILAGASALAATAALAPAAGSALSVSRSPELARWREAHAAYLAANQALGAAYSAWVDSNSGGKFPDYDRLFCAVMDGDFSAGLLLNKMASDAHAPQFAGLSAELGTSERALETAICALIARPVACWRDVAERVELLRAEQRWQPGVKRYDDEIACRELDALFAGIQSMAAREV